MRVNSRRRVTALAVSLALLGAAACSDRDGPEPGATPSTSTSAPPAVEVEPARLTERECDTAVDVATECWWLEVPERRDVAGARTIRLWVAVMTPPGATDDDVPWTVINGGPGDANSTSWVAGRPAPGGTKPLVIVDQRGTGRSEPHLDCQELASRVDPTLDLDARAEVIREQVTECAAGLRDDGVDLDGYDSTESAQDLAELRALLGYERWDLYGLSYGAVVAREAHRIDPEGVRRLFLDSPAVLDGSGPASLVARTEDSLAAVDAACAEGGACSAPGTLLADLDTAFERLEAEPHRVDLPDGSQLVIDGEQFMAGARQVLYQSSLLAVLPSAAAAVAGGDYSILDTLGAQLAAVPADPVDRSSQVVREIVSCADRPPATDEGDAVRAEPGRWGLLVGPDTCDAWGVTAVGEGTGLPEDGGDLPVLVTLGQFDPVAPPDTGEAIAASYPNTTVVVRPFGGHVVAFGDDCMSGIALQFLDGADDLDDGCLAQIPDPFAG